MKILRRILLGLVIIIAIPLIAALFIKKDYTVEREIVINKPKQEIFDYIKFLKNQDNYSKWQQMDLHMRKEYKGTDGTVGFISSWKSSKKDVGSGEQEITKITDGERIDTQIRFKEPFESTDNGYMKTIAIDSTSTKVIWGFSGAFPYPMNIMHLFFDMDKEVGGDLEVGLTNLKAVMEKSSVTAKAQ